MNSIFRSMQLEVSTYTLYVCIPTDLTLVCSYLCIDNIYARKFVGISQSLETIACFYIFPLYNVVLDFQESCTTDCLPVTS